MGGNPESVVGRILHWWWPWSWNKCIYEQVCNILSLNKVVYLKKREGRVIQSFIREIVDSIGVKEVQVLVVHPGNCVTPHMVLSDLLAPVCVV